MVSFVRAAGGGGSSFDVEDRWTISGAVLSLCRIVNVTGTVDGAGFYSSVRLSTEPSVGWEDLEDLGPALTEPVIKGK
jgi:hypothetical protein